MGGFSLRNQTIKAAVFNLLPNFLAVVLASFWAVVPAQAANVQLNRPSDYLIEITGGTGREAWHLTYGMVLGGEYKPLLVPAEGNRAWYAYGGWLRLIDTKKGEVVGRWHFPSVISALRPEGATVDAEIREKVWGFEREGSEISGSESYVARHVRLDPASPRVPFWPNGNLMLYRVPFDEVRGALPSVNIGGVPPHPKLSAKEAGKVLPELEELVRRDRFTPWFGVALGKVLMDIGDPRTATAFQEALNSPGADFTELLPISVYLDDIGEHKLARAAFDRGYRDFWTRGNDPRIFLPLIGRLMVYGPRGQETGGPSTEVGREIAERTYRLTPYGESAELAWYLYADYWRQKGQTDRARLWQARFEDSKGKGLFSWWRSEGTGGSLNFTLLFVPAGLLGIILYGLVLFLRYRPQRRLDRATEMRRGKLTRGFVFFNTEYWSRAERFSLFSIVFALWFATGLSGVYLEGFLRRAAFPIGPAMGNFGGPVLINMLETGGLPPSPYHDLFLAFAYQQDGQPEKAERLYRVLPQFAESWNNLGVILKNAGKAAEAKQAFERALQLDPALAEAALNLGQPPADLWTELHQEYLPGQPMLAPPRENQWKQAFEGGSKIRIYLRALLGPFSVRDPAGLFGVVSKLLG